MIDSLNRAPFASSSCRPGGYSEWGTLILGAHASGPRRRLTTHVQIHGPSQPDKRALSRPEQRWRSRLDRWDGRGRRAGFGGDQTV